MNTTTNTKIIEVKQLPGNQYAFLAASSFYAWIVLKNGGKIVRKSFETDTTPAQLIYGHKTELIMNLEYGYYRLINDVIKPMAPKIKICRIYATEKIPGDTKAVPYYELNNGQEWCNHPNFTKENIFKAIPFKVVDRKLFIEV